MATVIVNVFIWILCPALICVLGGIVYVRYADPKQASGGKD